MRNVVFSFFFFSLFFVVAQGRAVAQDVPDVPPQTRLENADSDYIEAIYQKALQKYREQEYAQSLHFIWHVLRSQPQNFKLRYLSAHNYWQLKDYASAIKELERCTRLNAREASSFIDLALLHMSRGHYISATAAASRGIVSLQVQRVLVPAKLYNVLARASLHRGDAETALKMAQKAKTVFDEQDQNNASIKDQLEAIVLEARALQSLYRFEEAELAMQWALALKEGDPYGKNFLGYVYETWAINLERKNPSDPQVEVLRNKAIQIYNEVLTDLELSDDLKKSVSRNLARLQ